MSNMAKSFSSLGSNRTRNNKSSCCCHLQPLRSRCSCAGSTLSLGKTTHSPPCNVLCSREREAISKVSGGGDGGSTMRTRLREGTSGLVTGVGGDWGETRARQQRRRADG